MASGGPRRHVASVTEAARNPFETLGVAASPETTDRDVRDAYTRASKECHPDRNPDDPDAAAKFAAVKDAYERLKTAEQRRLAAQEFGVAYEVGTRGARRGTFDEFFDRMDESAKEWRRRPYSLGPRDGQSLDREMAISLEQAFRGGSFRIDHAAARCGACHGAGRTASRFPVRCPTCEGQGYGKAAEGMIKVRIECPTCVGRGKVPWKVCSACAGIGQVEGLNAVVEVPAGVDTGFSIKLPGLGAPGVAGGRAGDLSVVLRVMENRVFQRRGDDLLARTSVWVWDAALGVRARVVGIDGRTLEFDVPPGCRSGHVRRLRGEGMSTLDGRRGDLLVKIEVAVPPAEGRMRELFEAMREAASEGPDAG
jgi:molecular chaperone DnaJ